MAAAGSRSSGPVVCAYCGRSTPPGADCVHCHRPLIIAPAGFGATPRPTANKPPAPQKKPTPPPGRVPTPPSPTDSLSTSLRDLGIQLTQRHIGGFVIAVVAGILVARILPAFWGYLDPLLQVFGSLRDDTNSYLMTTITALVSFLIALRVFAKP